MNSYNENLHSAVVSSLQSLDLEQQNLNAQVNASMFTLYHAEGATITAQQNLVEAGTAFGFKTIVQNQSVKNSNLSINLLSSATQANLYVKQSTTNVAVCASNVQIAANSIVRLASDIGSIFSIVNAADFDSDIYFHAENARELMNHTAYDAELASKLAMESSMLTAEVSASTVLDMAKATNTLMSTVLKITTADFDTATQNMATDNAALGAVRSTEKLAEGALEEISVDYKATTSAYNLSNRELNLDLKVTTSAQDSFSFTVDFDLIKSPFSIEKIAGKPMYPVKDYYLMVVKESKRQTFSVSNAENLQLKGNAEVIAVVPPETSHVSQEVDVYSTSEIAGLVTITDSDNEEINLGVNYVVFVMAIFEDDYKRKINCYDDYLSAPSQAFILTTRLESIPGKVIKISHFDKEELSVPELAAEESFKREQHVKNAVEMEDSGVLAEYTYVLRFEVKENLDKAVDYRCMLLPMSPDVADNLLTSESLKFLLDTEITSMEEISDHYDPKIAELQSYTYERGLKVQVLEGQLKALAAQLADFTPEKGTTADASGNTEESLKKEEQEVTVKIKELTKKLEKKGSLLRFMQQEKDDSIQSLMVTEAGKPGFLFNTTIAEQVYADSYTVAKKTGDTTADGDTTAQWIAFFGPDATDNFGNRLNKGERYLPVILSYSTAAEENAADFVNALSDMATTSDFKY